MKKADIIRLIVSICVLAQSFQLCADNQPPFDIKDPAINENFRNIYLQADKLSLFSLSNTGGVNLLCIDSPTFCVDAVNHSVVLSTGSATAPAVTFGGSAVAGFYVPSAGSLAYGNGGGSLFTILSSGRVGIGTSPIKRLDVRGESDGLLLLAPSDDLNTANDIFQITNASLSNVYNISKAGGFIARAPSSQITSSGESKFTIEADAASQSATLQLNTHNATTGQCTIYMGDGSSATKGKVNYDPSTNIYEIDTNSTQRFAISSGNFLLGPGTSNTSAITDLRFTTDSGGVRYAAIQGYRESDAANIHLGFFTMAGDTGGIIERFRIRNDGAVDVGAGGTSDQQNFFVTSSGGSQFRVLASGSSAVYVQTQSNHPLYFTTNNGVNSIEITTSHNVNIRGTATNDSAAAGFVGEAVRSATSTGVSSTGTGQWTDIVNISLTAGDWDISGLVVFSLNGATQTVALMAITSTSGNSATGQIDGDNRCPAVVPVTANDSSASIPNYRVSLSGTTTYYLKFRADFSAGTPKAWGRISARRVR